MKDKYITQKVNIMTQEMTDVTYKAEWMENGLKKRIYLTGDYVEARSQAIRASGNSMSLTLYVMGETTPEDVTGDAIRKLQDDVEYLKGFVLSMQGERYDR